MFTLTIGKKQALRMNRLRARKLVRERATRWRHLPYVERAVEDADSDSERREPGDELRPALRCHVGGATHHVHHPQAVLRVLHLLVEVGTAREVVRRGGSVGRGRRARSHGDVRLGHLTWRTTTMNFTDNWKIKSYTFVLVEPTLSIIQFNCLFSNKHKIIVKVIVADKCLRGRITKNLKVEFLQVYILSIYIYVFV